MTTEEYKRRRENGETKEQIIASWEAENKRKNTEVDVGALASLPSKAEQDAADEEAYLDYLAEYYKGEEDYGGAVGYYSHLDEQYVLEAQNQAMEAVKARGLDPASGAGQKLLDVITQRYLEKNPDYLENKNRLEKAQAKDAEDTNALLQGIEAQNRKDKRQDAWNTAKDAAGKGAAWMAGNLVPGLNFVRNVADWQKEQNYPEGEPVPDDWFRQYVGDSARKQVDTVKRLFGEDDGSIDYNTGAPIPAYREPTAPRATGYFDDSTGAPMQMPQQPERDWWGEYTSKVGDEWNRAKDEWNERKKKIGDFFNGGSGGYRDPNTGG